MIIGLLRLEFLLHDNESLKDKRRVSASLKQKLRTKFNVSVAEVEAQDSRTRLVLAVVSVAPDHKTLEGRLQKALNMVEAAATEDLVDVSTEFFSSE
jgi:uncharacterized protein YlxP (DUF503 family)